MFFLDWLEQMKESMRRPTFPGKRTGKAIRVAYQGDVIFATSDDPGFDEFVTQHNKTAFIKLRVKTIYVQEDDDKPGS